MKRRKKLEADIITAKFLRATLNAPTVLEAVRDCIRLSLMYEVEYSVEVLCQLRGNIVYVTPPHPGTDDSVDPSREVRYQKLRPWHIRTWRPARISENSCATIFDIHTALTEDIILKGMPSIYNDGTGDLMALRELRRQIQRDHNPKRYLPIGIEIRLRKSKNFCTIFQEKKPIGIRTLQRLGQKLGKMSRMNESVRDCLSQAGYNLIETSFGSRGFRITADQLQPFEFNPGRYYGK